MLLMYNHALLFRRLRRYLDLDMAFDDATFVSVYGKGSPKGAVGTLPEQHDQLLKREHVNFMEVLAGADSTSGVPTVALSVVEGYVTCQFQLKAATVGADPDCVVQVL
jgi:hypothetical protein